MNTSAPDVSATSYVRVEGPLSGQQFDALKRALAGGCANVTVIIPARNFSDVAGTPNRLFGSYINNEGDAT
jgi:hypothetical protein